MPNLFSFVTTPTSMSRPLCIALATVLLHAGLLPSRAQEDPVDQPITIGLQKVSSLGLMGRAKSLKARLAIAAKQGQPGKDPMPAALSQIGVTEDPDFNVSLLPELVRLVPDGDVALTEESLTTISKNLMDSGLFEYVEPDYIYTTQQVPTDSAYTDGRLWGIRNIGRDGGTVGIDVNATAAWNLTTGSPDIVVAVIDTGIRYTHQDLAGNMWTNPGEIAGNGIDDDGNGYVDDVYGINAITGSGDPMDDNNHGTHCAGTIAATANDAGQIVGVAYNVRLMACKFLSGGGSGSSSDAIECIDYATRMGAHITSNSWGGGGFSQAMFEAIQAANEAGSLFVAAAGNSSRNTDSGGYYPQGYNVPNVMSVAAIDRSGNLASFSNYGRTSVDVGAPGVAVLSSTAGSNSSYGTFSGTSMATPHVSGVAALVMSRSPNLTPVEVKEQIMSNTVPLASLNGRTVTGGMVDAFLAVSGGEDGILELTANSGSDALKPGQAAPFFVTVTDSILITNATVTGAFGSETPVSFRDDGTGPDQAAGDAVYSANLTIPSGQQVVSLDVTASAPGKTTANGSFDFDVIAPPSNDDFENRIVLAVGSTQTTGNNRNAGSQPGEPVNPVVAGGQSVWWEWNAPSTGSVTIDTAGSAYDTTLAVYTGFGNNFDALTLVAANDDSGGQTSSVTFSANVGGVYLIQVDGYRGAEGDITLNYPSPGEASGPPFITTQPSPDAIVEGDPFSFSVVAGGTLPLSFQWRKNGVPIPGATAPSYNAASSTLANAGSYSVSVNNPFGSVTSSSALLTVEPESVRPPNDRFADAVVLSGASGKVTGTNSKASGEPGEPDHAAASSPLDSIWFRWTAPADGTFSADTFGSSFDTTLALYTGTEVFLLTEIASNDDQNAVQSFISAPVTGGQTYYLAIDGAGDATGTVTLNYFLQPAVPGLANDDFANRTVVPGTGTTTTGTNIGATGESGEPVHTPFSAPLGSVWWGWTAPFNGIAVIDTQGSDFDTSLAVYTGSSVDALTPVAANDDFGGLQSQVSFNCVAGTSYAIAVDGGGAAQGDVVLNVVSGSTAPEIAVEQPEGSDLPDGSAVVDFGAALTTRSATRSFTVRNTGAANLTGLGISFDGPHAADFRVTTRPFAPVPPLGVTTFTVEFGPSGSGTRSATLRLSSNDSDESPFDIDLTGNGIEVPPGVEFRILTLDTKGAVTIETNSRSGDDRSGIAVSPSRVFVNGDTRAASFDAATLGSGANLSGRLDGLCSDVGTGTIYTLATDGAPFVEGGSTVNQLLELDPDTGAQTGTVITLSSPISIGTDCGVFSGSGRIVIHNGTNAIDIRVPSGAVVDLGPMPRPDWQTSESWSVSGVAEFFGGELYLAYRENGTDRIERALVPTGATESIATFTNLGDMANFTVSEASNRWYFSHEGSSQFGSHTETLGYADATFQVLPLPTITSPSSRSAYAGQTLTYQILAEPEITSYNASGLPSGLGIDTGTGLISGSVSSAGTYPVTISATNAAGTTDAVLTLNIETMPVTFFDDFDPSQEPGLWEDLSGGAQANTYGQAAGSGSSGNSLWFGGEGSRHAMTLPLDTRSGGKVSFKLAQANGSTGTWEAADPGEGILVEYSTDGITFTAIDGPLSATLWQNFELDIPAGARAFGTQFRFRQLSHTGANLDHWAVEDVRIGSQAALVPEIAVELPGISILADGLDELIFPETPPGQTSDTRVTIRNLGIADLAGLSAAFGGADADLFSMVAVPASTVPPGGQTTFTVRYAPETFGTHTAYLTLANNDPNESAFRIDLRGASVDPLDFFDDFDPSYTSGIWTQFGGSVTANLRGQAAGPGSIGNSLHFDGNGNRRATTEPLDTSAGGVVTFSVALGNSTGVQWESPEAGEEVVLEYSTDGSTYVQMGGPYDARTWDSVEEVIPPAARTTATQFRFRQLSHSGSALDHWAIEDVRIGSAAP